MCGFKRFFRQINWSAICVLVFLFCTEAVAAEGKSNWRATYDIVMMWVNFLILVFLIVKFGKAPVKNFLNGQREELSGEISGLEGQRDEMVRQVKETIKKMEQSQVRFKEIRDKIISKGKARKQEIIEEAGFQSRIMLEDAQRRVENQILTAEKKFRADLVDEAMDLALKNIGQYITEEDNQKLLQQFLASAVPK